MPFYDLKIIEISSKKMDFNKYSHEKKIVKLNQSDRDFLKNKAVDYLNNSTMTFPLFIFVGTLVGIYHFDFWDGFFLSLVLFFLYETKNLIKAIPILLGLISGKKITGIGKMVYKIDKEDNYFSRAVKVELDKPRTIFLNSNEGYDHTLTKIKIGHIFYIELTLLHG